MTKSVVTIIHIPMFHMLSVFSTLHSQFLRLLYKVCQNKTFNYQGIMKIILQGQPSVC